MTTRHLFYVIACLTLTLVLAACNLQAPLPPGFATLTPATTEVPTTVTTTPTESMATPTLTEAVDQPTVTPGATSATSNISGVCANPLLPITLEAKWDYTLTGFVTDKFTRSITNASAEGFTERDVFATGVIRTGEWQCQNGNLLALQPSGTAATITSEYMAANFHTTSYSGVTLPATVNPGDSWSQSIALEGSEKIGGQDVNAKNDVTLNCTAAGAESVTVPAGTFEAMRVDCNIDMRITITMQGFDVPPTTIQSQSVNWYAPGVGLVKNTESGDFGESTIELTGYNIP